MLLHLRWELVSVPAGQRVIVGREEVFEQLAGYRDAASTDAALFAKRIRASWDAMSKLGILQPTPATQTEGRYEISPVLRLIFGPDEISAVSAVYDGMLAGGQVSVSEGDESLSEDEGSPDEEPREDTDDSEDGV